MAYTPTTWKDDETAITADRLNNIEQGITDKAERGPKGDPGKDGSPGADGADGFPSESDWNDLVGRVDALEAAAE